MDTENFIAHANQKMSIKTLLKILTPQTTKSRDSKNKKVIRLMKDKLGWKIMKRVASLRPKMYSYLTDDGYIDKKVKGTKEYGIKRHIKSRD